MNQKERLICYYNQYAPVYEKKHGVAKFGQFYNFKNHYEPFLKKFLPHTGTVFEIGCGTGVYTRWLLDEGLSVVGMDISSEMLRQARHRCPEALFLQGDCEDPATFLNAEITRSGFDAIVGINAFSYFPHKERALIHVGQLLRPEGRLILIDMNGACPYYEMMAWLNKNEMRGWINEVRQSNECHFRSLLERTDFRIDALEHFAFIPNGAGQGVVLLLRPFDHILESIPPIRHFAMRIAVAATKK